MPGPWPDREFGLMDSRLGQLMPAEPVGSVVSGKFMPTLTKTGIRHPVTAPLNDKSWSSWYRQVETRIDPDARILMTGQNGLPLLVVDEAGKGRIAQILSDHFWLWARDVDGGGPYLELFRRLAHWLMKEPELEEHRLTAKPIGTVENPAVLVERTGLADSVSPVEITGPDGEKKSLPLTERTDIPGLFTGSLPVSKEGLYHVRDGDKSAVVNIGFLNLKEFDRILPTADSIEPVARKTGGGVLWAEDTAAPYIRRTDPDQKAVGRNWLGLKKNRIVRITGIREHSLIPWYVLALLGILLIGLAWRREGK
jgi:hypothetical protein